MGAVYLAKDMALGRLVALKVLLGSLARNPDQVRRFQREAKAAAPLLHPNIVRIYEAGIRDGTPYIAMEFVEGEPLDHFLHRLRKPLKWQHALYIAEQVCEALDCAHKAGVVHRDVKPANILLDRQGRIRLTDFGIANARESEEDTRMGLFVGTPDYMSPEQCAGDRRVTPASDLFSLGVTLYQMLSGRMPFEGRTTVALINSIATESPPRLSSAAYGVPDDVARLVAHLLEKAPEHRPASARSVCETIQRLHREGGGASALPEALDAFIRECAAPRSLRVDTPALEKKKAFRPRLILPERRKYWLPISTLSKLAAVLLLTIGALGVGYWHYLRPGVIPDPAPRLHDLSFCTENPGTYSVPLPDTQWSVRQVRWVGGKSVVVAAVAGREGTTGHGAEGLLAADPETRCVLSLRPPAGPVLDADYWDVRPVGQILGPIPATPPDALLSDVILLQAASYPRKQMQAAVMTLPQRWDEAYPRREVLCRVEKSAWYPDLDVPWYPAQAAHAILKPDGRRLCMLVYDEVQKTNYLAERDIRWHPHNRLSSPLTTAGAPILPSSVQYSPDGSSIAYIRAKNSGDRELWVVPSDGSRTDGTVLAVGRLDSEVAFSPDGVWIAFTKTQDGVSRPMLVRVADGSSAGQMGRGRVSAECWHPSGSYLVLSDADMESGTPQLWAMETAAPYRRHMLTRLPNGVRHPGALSRDGRWAVTATESSEGAALVFVDLSMVLFSV